ncbi:hypothetical protein [Cumulibacter soli]|uniref:hypothetical protein n=1 Tax=Cumulibacter soli TaxID=2546344 RepID=UPI0010684D04|nr:hypothetical protein [Cumulibacter soli]
MATLSNRPLLSTSVDRDLVIERGPECARVESAVAQRLNVLLSGSAGSGLTTTIHQLLRRLPREALHPRFVNAATIGSVEELLHEALSELVPAMAVVDGDSAYAKFARFTGVPDNLVVLVDNAPARLLIEAFGTHRDDMWQVPVAWVVTCTELDRSSVLSSRASDFFDVVVELGPLTDVEAAGLLRRRVNREEMDAAALRVVVATSGGNPRALVQSARRIVLEGVDPAELSRSVFLRREIGRPLSRPARMLLEELVTRGPASASDPALQAATGWTRSRLVQVLAELEAAGAVDSEERSAGRSGRPRKVFRSRY